MFMLDIDRFKLINDTWGHDVGDDVITQLGNVLAEKFVNNEIVGRFGGDEFIVFIKGLDDLDKACQQASEIIQSASEKISLPTPSAKVSVSIGITIYHGVEKNYSEIFKKADIALYKAKASKKNRFFVFE